MIPKQHNRLDSSEITHEQLTQLNSVFAGTGPLTLVNEEGHQIALPDTLFKHLARIVQLMSEERSILLIPEDESFTTQAAANYLGFSRQYLVNLLEEGHIPFYKVGSHRRIKFKDLLAYEKQRDKQRREALDRLMKQVDDAGLYVASYTGEDP